MNQTQDVGKVDERDHEGKGKEVKVEVNNKTVVLPDKKVTGLEVKEAAMAQGVEIQLDFILTLEAEHGNPAEQIADDREIKVDKHSRFSCNDGDDNS